MLRIVCFKCAEKAGRLADFRQACCRVLSHMGPESNCSMCGKPNGGAEMEIEATKRDAPVAE